MRKWPTVPHCYGWLAMDARGDWYLRDEPAQAAGPFPRPKGSRIEHDGLREFIERNYEADARGCWYFQNGPQRVYVELEAAPRVYRLQAGDAATGGRWRISLPLQRTARYRAAWLDESGRLFLECDLRLRPAAQPGHRYGCAGHGGWRLAAPGDGLCAHAGPLRLRAAAAARRRQLLNCESGEVRSYKPHGWSIHAKGRPQAALANAIRCVTWVRLQPMRRRPAPWVRRTWRRPCWP